MQPHVFPHPAKWTILEVVRWTTSRFEKHGIESARLDAELLAAAAFSLTRVELYTHFDRPLAEEERNRLRELVRRRLAGEPVAYLLGHKEFWNLEFSVDPRVLIPRPDTETLVEEALSLLPSLATLRPPRVADIGTGSGALALAIKKEKPEVEMWATDISAEALRVAEENANRHRLIVHFRNGHLTEPLTGNAPFDLLVSNPPYIPSGDIPSLSPEVRNEPLLALDGGSDGLAVVRELLSGAGQVLRPGGALAIEIGIGQAEPTQALFVQAGFQSVRARPDLAGIPRVISGHLERTGS